MEIVGLDPSMKNWGIARGRWNIATDTIEVTELGVIQPVLPTGKQVRNNSKDLEAATQLATGVLAAIGQAKAVFVEVPVGSQSARAMASYGICVGILGALRAQGIPFFEVTPTEVKLVACGKKTATKRDMIQWAYDTHPTAPWPFHTKNGQRFITEGKAEHMADAVAAIYAGMATTTFQQLRPFWEASTTPVIKEPMICKSP